MYINEQAQEKSYTHTTPSYPPTHTHTHSPHHTPLTSSTVSAGRCCISSESSRIRLSASISFTRSTWSHQRSSPAVPNVVELSGGGSRLSRHTDEGTLCVCACSSYILGVVCSLKHQNNSENDQGSLLAYRYLHSQSTSRDLFERFSCPLCLACLRRASETPLVVAALAWKPGLSLLPRPLCIFNLTIDLARIATQAI